MSEEIPLYKPRYDASSRLNFGTQELILDDDLSGLYGEIRGYAGFMLDEIGRRVDHLDKNHQTFFVGKSAYNQHIIFGRFPMSDSLTIYWNDGRENNLIGYEMPKIEHGGTKVVIIMQNSESKGFNFMKLIYKKDLELYISEYQVIGIRPLEEIMEDDLIKLYIATQSHLTILDYILNCKKNYSPEPLPVEFIY